MKKINIYVDTSVIGGCCDPEFQEWSIGILKDFQSGTFRLLLSELTDAEIEASIANDPDWAEFKDIDWSKAVFVIPPKKKAISIRVDEDVLDHFKREGVGYQRRMNAVLRSYVEQKRKAPARKKKRA